LISPEKFLEGQVLLIDKPLHWSSFQAVNKVKWSLKKHLDLKKLKVGHAGTLDPLATGLRLPATWMQKVHLQESRLYIQGQNLFTITNYLGMDPENQSTTSLQPLRIVTAGIQLTF
jgi:tRNA pseudouridine55 synthase